MAQFTTTTDISFKTDVELLNTSLISNINGTSNGSVYDDYYTFKGYPLTVVAVLATIMVFIIVFAVFGNMMVVLTIVRHRGMRTRTNMFIVNLAVADILVSVLDMPVSLITIISGRWVFYEALCKLNAFTMALFLISSIHTLMYISVHKYISITRPFSRAMTPIRIKIMILASWTWAAFCATGPLIGLNKNVYKPGASQCGPALPSDTPAITHSILITTSNYVIPLCVMCFCYAGIFYEIHVHMRRIRETSNIDLVNTVAQQKKVATTLVLVLACFLFCWTPFIIYSNAMVMRKGRISPIINPLAYWCGYFNSACNPIIYAFRSPSFRKGYKEIMCGAQSAKLSAVNSMSFRSRSARGSIKPDNNLTNQKDDEGAQANSPPRTDRIHRQRTLLSQTSWRSMPIIPSLVRSFSVSKDPNCVSRGSPSPETSPDCGFCGCFSSRYRRPPIQTENQEATYIRRSAGRQSPCEDIQEESEEEEAAAGSKRNSSVRFESSAHARHSVSHEIEEGPQEDTWLNGQSV